MVHASPEYCPSVGWPTLMQHESSGGVLIAVQVLTLHTVYLWNNAAVNYN